MSNIHFLYLVLWFVIGAAQSGLLFAFHQRHWPLIAADHFDRDRLYATTSILLGPIALFATLMVCRPMHGWLFPWSTNARVEAIKAQLAAEQVLGLK